MKKSPSLTSFEPDISEETSASLPQNVVIQENPIPPRKKSLFEFEPFYQKKKLSLHKASPAIQQSKVLHERLLIFSTSMKSFESESVEDYCKFCPLIPNGTWVHIPFNWLPMMTSVIDVITRAIEENDIQIIYQLKESYNEFYNQLVNIIPKTPILNQVTDEFDTIDKCVDILTSHVLSISDSIFLDDKDDLSSLSHKAEKWFIPSATTVSPYFDLVESTPFNDLLDFMMNLPTVARKSKVLQNSDTMLTEKDISNENFDLSDSISVRALIETQDLEIKEQAFQGLLESNLVYGTIYNDIVVQVNLAALELSEFNVKFVNTSRIVSGALSSEEEISQRDLDKEDMAKEGSRESVRSIQLIEHDVFKIGENKKKNEEAQLIDGDARMNSRLRTSIDDSECRSCSSNHSSFEGLPVKQTIKREVEKKYTRTDIGFNDRISGRISVKKTTSGLKANRKGKKKYQKGIPRSGLRTSLISKRFLDSIKPRQLHISDLQIDGSKKNVHRNLILEEIVEQSEYYCGDKLLSEMYKYKNMAVHFDFLEKRAKKLRLVLLYKFAKIGIFDINTKKKYYEMKTTRKSSQPRSNIFTKCYENKQKLCADVVRPIFGCSLHKIRDNKMIKKFKPIKLHHANACGNTLLGNKVSYTPKLENLRHAVEDQHVNFSKKKSEYKVIKEKHRHLYNPRINSSPTNVNRGKTRSVTLDINTIVGNLSNSRRIYKNTRSHSVGSVGSISRD